MVNPSTCGGVLLDEYYKLFNNQFLNEAALGVEYFGGARHALFFAVPMLLLGGYIEAHKNFVRKDWRIRYLVAFFVVFALSFIEVTMLKNAIGTDITMDVSIFGWMPAVPLLLLGLSSESRLSANKSRRLRKITDVVYIIHIWPVVIITKVLGMKYVVCFLLVTVTSFIIGLVLVNTAEKLKKLNSGNC